VELVVVVVGTIPIKSDSSDEIPASSSLVTPVVLILLLGPADDVDFNLDVDDDDESRFRRFAANTACIPPLSS